MVGSGARQTPQAGRNLAEEPLASQEIREVVWERCSLPCVWGVCVCLLCPPL